jgi:glycosyltransferase involved in cell wall biosynthesis
MRDTGIGRQEVLLPLPLGEGWGEGGGLGEGTDGEAGWPSPQPSPRGRGGNTERARAPRVSVVIPTYRRPELLRRCLDALLAQTLPPEAFEIIVVDDGHDERTRNTVEALAAGRPYAPRLRYLRPAHGRGPAVARNAGWRAAAAPLVAFTDDDTIPAPGWLAHGERAMAEAGVSAVCGRVEVPLDQPVPTDHERMTQGLQTAEFVTANAFVRREALMRIGGFDERFTRAWREDSDLQFRLMRECRPVGRCEQAVVLHPARAERWGVSLRQQRNTFFDALLYKKHPALYRQRIRRVPPWNYYLIVALALAAPLLVLAGQAVAAGTAALAAAALVLHLAFARLRHTARTRQHVTEMLATSVLIPFLSVYWRLRGAIHFRTAFL